MEIVELAEKHPYATGAVVIVGGLGVLYLLGFFTKAPAANTGIADPASTVNAYYAAEAAQASAGAAEVINQQNNTAGVSIAGIQAGSNQAIAGIGESEAIGTLAQEGYNQATDLTQEGYNAAALAQLGATTAIQETALGEAATVQDTQNTNSESGYIAAIDAAESESNTQTMAYGGAFSPAATEFVSTPYGNYPVGYGTNMNSNIEGDAIGGLGVGLGESIGSIAGDTTGAGSAGGGEDG